MRLTKNKNKLLIILPGKRGFSLVELMVVVAIIGIMSAIATPGIMHWLPNYRLKSAARDLYSTLQKARLMAVRENSNIQVTFTDNSANPAKESFYILNDINNNGILDAQGEIYMSLSSYGSGVDFGFPAGLVDWNGTAVASAINFSGTLPPWTYNSNGTTTGNGTIYLMNIQAHIVYAVTIVTSGAIKLRKYNGLLPYNKKNWIE